MSSGICRRDLLLFLAVLLTAFGNSVPCKIFGDLDALRMHAYSVEVRRADKIIEVMAMPDSYMFEELNTNNTQDEGNLSKQINGTLNPFLETYYHNMSNMYAMVTQNMLERTTKAMNESLVFKDKTIKEMNQLSNDLNATDFTCQEERRDVKTVAFELVSGVYQCNKQAMFSIRVMDNYFWNLINVTTIQMNEMYKNYLDENSSSRCFPKEICIAKLSATAVGLAYELDTGLTNAKNHFEITGDDFLACYQFELRQANLRRIDLIKKFHYCVEA